MLQKLQKHNKSQGGFTIIEVLIVLAIAGLIMLIVFLAVPALQRTARNTQRKNDVSAMASAIANYITDNNGDLPSTATYAAGVVTFSCPTTTSICTATTNTETANIGYYTVQPTIYNASANPGDPTTTTVKIDMGYACNANNTGISTTAQPRTAALLYEIEPSSYECLEQ